MFDATDPAASAAALKQASYVAALVADHPERFEGLQEEYCCTDAIRVTEGRDTPAVERQLAQLVPGAIAKEPVRSNTRYLVIKRLPLSVLPALPPIATELPAPASVDLDYVVGQFVASFIQTQLRIVGERSVALFGSNSRKSRELLKIHEKWGKFADELPTRIKLDKFHELARRVAKLLPPLEYARYRTTLTQLVEQALLTTSP